MVSPQGLAQAGAELMSPSVRKALASGELLTAGRALGLWFCGHHLGVRSFFALRADLFAFCNCGVFARVFLKEVRGVIRSAFSAAILLSVTLIFQTWGSVHNADQKWIYHNTLRGLRAHPRVISLKKSASLVAVGLRDPGARRHRSDREHQQRREPEHRRRADLYLRYCRDFQIYWLGVISPKIQKPFVFNLVQAAWGALLCAPVLLTGGLVPKFASMGEWSFYAWTGLLALTFGSTVIAFYLQVRAQKYLSATVSSLIFLLESPFALIFSLLLLGQSLNKIESIGAAMIFLRRHLPRDRSTQKENLMSLWQSLILAVVEGLTEYLPVSSTGHLILTSWMMGINQDPFVKDYTVMVQFGAILAVLVLYAKRFLLNVRVYPQVLFGFLPAAVVGLLVKKYIDIVLATFWWWDWRC